MANISISEIRTEATTLASDDLFLVSKKNGSAFTSAKMKASNANGLSNVRFVVGNVRVYISPTGSDDNFENQLKYYDTDQQIEYPLFTINKACEFLSRFKALGDGKQTIYYIKAAEGTYNYTETQLAYHTDCCCTGCYIYITPIKSEHFSRNDAVQFKLNASYTAGFHIPVLRAYSNLCITNCHISSTVTNSSSTVTVTDAFIGLYGGDSARVTVYGCKFTNLYCGMHFDNMNWSSVSSAYTTETKELVTQHVPTDISNCSYGIISYTRMAISGYLKIQSKKPCFVVHQNGSTANSYDIPSRFVFQTDSTQIFASWFGNSSYNFGETLWPQNFNIYTKTTQTQPFSVVADLFNVEPNSDTYSKYGIVSIHESIMQKISDGLNQSEPS